jgi:glycosyltransferase involved in cell wall biosynthesis
MWQGRRVSVVLPTYNERDSIAVAIQEFFATGWVDEVIVVDNNAAAGTAEEVARTPARLVHEPRQGYGYACQRGLAEATGDLLVLSEPDGTFLGKDVLKLLAYSDDFAFVIGTRTSKEMILEGANMGLWLKWGNVAVAKMTEVLFNTTILTDMGCTMRLLHRSAYETIRPGLTIGGSHFGPQMLLEAVLAGIRFMEIPVNYNRRVGVSSVTGSTVAAIRLGLRMILLVWEYRIGSWLGTHGPASRR